MDKLDGIAAFVQVVDSRNYVAAGRVLGISASAVGKAIVRLEERVGVRLFHRNNRSIGLTAEGAAFLVHCRAILAEFALAESGLSRTHQTPTGKLRVSAPVVSEAWNRVFMNFMEAYPDVDLEVSYTNRLVDLIEEGYDVVLRIGPLQDSRLLTRRLGTFALRLVASPAYLERHGTPETIADLANHASLRNRNVSSSRIDPWPLGPHHIQLSARLNNKFVADNYAALRSTALSGFGIACLPSFWADEDIADGTLRHLLPDLTRNERTVAAVWSAGRIYPAKLAAFIDFMALHLPVELR